MGLALAATLGAAACSGDGDESADTTTTTEVPTTDPATDGTTTTTAPKPGTVWKCRATGTFTPPGQTPIEWADVAGTVTIKPPAGGPPALYQFRDGDLLVTVYSPVRDAPATVVAQLGEVTYQSPLESDAGTEVDELGSGGSTATDLLAPDGSTAPIDLTFACVG